MSTVNIEIDGKQLEAPQGSMIIEAADQAGVYIPRFCYHKKLSIAANCRMCLVEVEKSRKPLPACATPVSEGMKVYTQSPMALESQKTVMEFLLANHPLDCPICDQGGECELQDLSMGYGDDQSSFNETKRSVHDIDIGPLIETHMTRCIHCTRCVRFGVEIAGVKELGMTQRGEESEITTYISQSLTSELSANIIDLCPVGALTSKPFRFQARSWELQQFPSIAPHDSLGSHISVHTRRQQVLRILPRDNEEINENWLSDRDRFSYLGLYENRVEKPFVRKQNDLEEADWATAFKFITDSFELLNIRQAPDAIGAYVSPNTTLEEVFLLQKLMKGLGSAQIEYRLRQTDLEHQVPFGLPLPLNEIEEQSSFIVIGSNIVHEQPILGLRMRKAVQNGASLYSINSVHYDFHMEQKQKIIVPPSKLFLQLSAILKVYAQKGLVELSEPMQNLLKNTLVETIHEVIAEEWWRNQGNKIFILGEQAIQHPQFLSLYEICQAIAKILKAQVAVLPVACNSVGIQRLLKKQQLKPLTLDEKKKVIFLYQLEPEFDTHHFLKIKKQLEQASLVIALTTHHSPFLHSVADIVLPIATFVENSGTYINAEGKVQRFRAATQAYADSRPGWKVLRVLGNFLSLPDFDINSADEIYELMTKGESLEDTSSEFNWHLERISDINTIFNGSPEQFEKITECPIYRVDALVRRSNSLQLSSINLHEAVYLHPEDAKIHQFNEGDLIEVSQDEQTVVLPLKLSGLLPRKTALLPAAYEKTAQLGAIYGFIKLRKTL